MKLIDEKMDGRKHRVEEDNGRDHHLDFDMFDYIYSLVSTVDSYSRIKEPLDHKLKKFDVPLRRNSDKGMATNNEILPSRISVDAKDSLFVYSDDIKDFDDLIEVCKLYKFSYEGPIAINSAHHYWSFKMGIKVPTISSGIPMMLEDYFNDIGVGIEQVMPESWVTSYRGKLKRLNNNTEKELKQMQFDKAFDKAVKNAWLRGDIDLEEHFKNLVADLEEKGVKYVRCTLHRKFMEVFEDDVDPDATVATVTELFA